VAKDFAVKNGFLRFPFLSFPRSFESRNQ